MVHLCGCEIFSLGINYIHLKGVRFVDIAFDNNRLAKECNDSKRRVKAHGEARAKLMQRRLDAIRAAQTLEDLRNTPGRLHELKGNRKWQLSFDLDGPYRLTFYPNPTPPTVLLPDGGMDWTRVTAVTISGVEDTHE